MFKYDTLQLYSCALTSVIVLAFCVCSLDGKEAFTLCGGRVIVSEELHWLIGFLDVRFQSLSSDDFPFYFPLWKRITENSNTETGHVLSDQIISQPSCPNLLNNLPCSPYTHPHTQILFHCAGSMQLFLWTFNYLYSMKLINSHLSVFQSVQAVYLCILNASTGTSFYAHASDLCLTGTPAENKVLYACTRGCGGSVG